MHPQPHESALLGSQSVRFLSLLPQEHKKEEAYKQDQVDQINFQAFSPLIYEEKQCKRDPRP